MSKLVVTEAGLKLQKDIIKEVGMPNLGKNRLSLVEDNNSPNNTLMLNLKTTRTHDDDNIFFITKSHSFSPNKPRSSLIEQHLINEQPNGIPLSIAERKKKQAYDEILKNSPYINQKVKKMNKDMEKYMPKYMSNNLSPSLGRSSINDVMNGSNSVKMTNSISISNLYTSTSNQDNIFHTFTNDESTMTKKDDFMINQHHKILHMESVIEKIVDRYKESKNRLDKIQRDIDKQYQQKVKIIMDKNHKPPEFLENIKKNNNDAIQIIAHKTRAQFRQKNRIESQFKEKYLKYWKKVHADEPKSAKKTSHIVDKEQEIWRERGRESVGEREGVGECEGVDEGKGEGKGEGEKQEKGNGNGNGNGKGEVEKVQMKVKVKMNVKEIPRKAHTHAQTQRSRVGQNKDNEVEENWKRPQYFCEI